jgi:hypothetical protein
MTSNLLKRLRTNTGYIISILVCAAVFELATCVGRFGLKISFKEKEAAIKKLTFGIRIHHSHVGIAIILIASVVPLFSFVKASWLALLGVIGWGLLLSDAIHHFLVLYLITGNTEFP